MNKIDPVCFGRTPSAPPSARRPEWNNGNYAGFNEHSLPGYASTEWCDGYWAGRLERLRHDEQRAALTKAEGRS